MSARPLGVVGVFPGVESHRRQCRGGCGIGCVGLEPSPSVSNRFCLGRTSHHTRMLPVTHWRLQAVRLPPSPIWRLACLGMPGLGHRPPPPRGWQGLRTTTTLAAHRTERLDTAKPNAALPNRCRRTVVAPFSMGRRRSVRVRRRPRSRHKERLLSCSQTTGTRGTRRTRGVLCSVRWDCVGGRGCASFLKAEVEAKRGSAPCQTEEGRSEGSVSLRVCGGDRIRAR